MDCYFHNAVPSVVVCRDCARTICATCRDSSGICPSCRLQTRIDAAAAARPRLEGAVGPSSPPPGPAPGAAMPERRRSAALATLPVETRALLGLGYPLWPLAALALLTPPRAPAIRRQALQALGFNFGFAGLWFGLGAISNVPLLGLSAFPLLAMLLPVWLVAATVYGIKVWNGDEPRVPIVSDWLEEREGRAHAA